MILFDKLLSKFFITSTVCCSYSKQTLAGEKTKTKTKTKTNKNQQQANRKKNRKTNQKQNQNKIRTRQVNVTLCHFIYKVLNLSVKTLHLSATYPSAHSKSVGKLSPLCTHPGPFLPFLHCTSQCPNIKVNFVFSPMGARFGEMEETAVCSSCSLLWKPKCELFSLILLNLFQWSASQQPLWEKWRKGSWNKKPTIQYCKITSELPKNCVHQRLSCCATIR